MEGKGEEETKQYTERRAIDQFTATCRDIGIASATCNHILALLVMETVYRNIALLSACKQRQSRLVHDLRNVCPTCVFPKQFTPNKRRP